MARCAANLASDTPGTVTSRLVTGFGNRPGRGILSVSDPTGKGNRTVANTSSVFARVHPALISDAREGAERDGLSSGASVSELIRYALAVMAGRPDPCAAAAARPGPKPRDGTAA